MLAANDAKKLSDENRQHGIELQLKDIEEKISNAANRGYYKIKYNDLFKEVKEELINLGYRFEDENTIVWSELPKMGFVSFRDL